MLPLIGLTTAQDVDQNRPWRHYYYTPTTYTEAILQAGGIPVLIPLNVLEGDTTERLRALYERLDGVLIPGGGDIHPANYGQYVTPQDTLINRARDAVEITLAQWAYNDDRPLLGICRGHQVINVALGGTLVHDIPTERITPLHHDQDMLEIPSRLAHHVRLEAESRLAQILGETHLEVNSLHHQSVADLAPSLRIAAAADDGIVEAVEAPNAFFYMGVQWHPEWLTGNVPVMQNLFAAFVQACTERARLKLE